jgi:hypothetical protein
MGDRRFRIDDGAQQPARNRRYMGQRRRRASRRSPGELEVVEGMPDGGKIQELVGEPSAFTPDYAPEEMFEVATKLYKASR